MGAVSAGARSVVDRISTRVRSLLLFLWYAALLTMHVIAVVTLFQSGTGPYTFAFGTVVLGALGHLIVPLVGIALFEGYIMHPVWPRLAFVVADIVAATFLGLTIGFGTSREEAWPAIGNIVLALVMLMQCAAYVVIGLDVRDWFEDDAACAANPVR